MYEAITYILILISKAFLKILVMLLGVLIAFLTVPQTRVAAMLGVAILSSFAGGTLMELYSEQQNWSVAFSTSLAFGAGFVVYPFLTFFRKFNELVNQDQEIVETIFSAMKRKIKSVLADKEIDNKEK